VLANADHPPSHLLRVGRRLPVHGLPQERDDRWEVAVVLAEDGGVVAAGEGGKKEER